MSKLFLTRLKELQGDNSVSAFARQLEMPQTTLNSYVLGLRKPSVELVERICLKFNVTSDWLLGLSDRREAFIAVPRQNNVSKMPEIKEKFSSFGRPVCRSVRQYNKR